MNSRRADKKPASKPETCGAAMLVPLISTIRLDGSFGSKP